MTIIVGQRADVITGSMITDSITGKDVMITNSITGRDVKNTDSSAGTDNLGAKEVQGDTSTILDFVSPSRRRPRTIYGLQLKNCDSANTPTSTIRKMKEATTTTKTTTIWTLTPTIWKWAER